jgi:hypothetical protein
MFYLFQLSAAFHFMYVHFMIVKIHSDFSLHSFNQLIFVMVNCGVLFRESFLQHLLRLC